MYNTTFKLIARISKFFAALLIVCLSVLHNYFDDLTKFRSVIFSNIFLI